VSLALSGGIDVGDGHPSTANDIAVHVTDTSPDLSGVPLRKRRRAA